MNKVAVLGSGVMGTGIACHLANIGMDVLMLDIVPKDVPADAPAKMKNAIADKSLKAALKSKPAPLYKKSYASRITTGNFDDDLHKIKDYDWILEVIIERLDIKQGLFAKVDEHRKKGTLVSSNTSGIPIHMMAEGRSEDFKKHFCGTHFFNPPRYLRLLEIIPTKDTDQSVVDFFMHFGDINLGKKTVKCKDTPGFIANRVGVYGLARILELTQELGLTITEVDKLTGPATGRPKTGTFRLADLVGNDVIDKVMKGLKENAPHDDMVQKVQMPDFFKYLIDQNFLGDKTGKGFYHKTKERDEKGKSIILGLNLNTNEHEATQRPSIPSLALAKQVEDLKRRFKVMFEAEDKGGELIRRSTLSLFAYASHRIPEISDQVYPVDDALKAGFAWELGPFEFWDVIGLEEGIKLVEAEGETVADWVKEMLAAGNTAFYKLEGGLKKCYNPETKQYEATPGANTNIILDAYRENAPVFKNDEVSLHDIGDGVLCLEFTSKMNSIGEGVLRGMQECLDIMEDGDWTGMVIGNNAQHFTVGANLMLIGMMAFQQQWDQLNMAVKLFQDTTMRCRYSNKPVVVATQGYVFGGGCETLMHCDASVVAAESYIGLVEVGVGLIPGGGGTKEFALRASDSFFAGDVMMPTLIERFKTIAMASVATSGPEAYDHAYLIKGRDRVVANVDRNIHEAKKDVIRLADGYLQPVPRTDIHVLGRGGMATLYAAAHSLKLGKYASEHDIKIANKVAYVLCGGDLTGAQKVSEKYLLDIEREAFLSLCGETKTMERIQYMLEKNKPLRN